MYIPSVFKTICRTISSVDTKILSVKPLPNIANRTMHMCHRQYLNDAASIHTNKISSMHILQPFVPLYNHICGLKMKTVLHRRCKSCIEMWKNDRKYIKCKAHPRHNQVQRKKQPYNTWILTFASQKPQRDW
ncbi:mitochondrial ribosomal protein L36 [Ptiloglossa arizonensis]|uniref:mitochondrial ribosomal protein L36 n=1 Tax=Ptiloglossa arizonensis TaxID=3350558 RepID=UPI003FA0E6EE